MSINGKEAKHICCMCKEDVTEPDLVCIPLPHQPFMHDEGKEIAIMNMAVHTKCLDSALVRFFPFASKEDVKKSILEYNEQVIKTGRSSTEEERDNYAERFKNAIKNERNISRG